MKPTTSLHMETRRTLARLLPRIRINMEDVISRDPRAWEQFTQRIEKHFPRLFGLYLELYGTRYDFFYHLENLLLSLAHAWFERPLDLQELDATREKDPLWFQSNQVLGGVIYVDLFANDLEGVRSKIPYFKELGLTYLHLMPLFKVDDGENDGGYAVSSYREVHAPLGTMEQLASLARDLRSAGISLVVDLVFNHTADTHAWAEHAKNGELEYQEMYYIYPNREMPDAYERSLREIFPDEHPGAFTYFPDLIPAASEQNQTNNRGAWVWTTFHSYQWDLNYANPAVFNHMAEEMLFLANQGVEVLRLDAVAFIWKELGTNCENLPAAHRLIQAFNAAARISAPALLFKSEAIVHPDDVVKYISTDECQISYNPLLMALLWNSLATRQVNMLDQALNKRIKINPQTAWVNYVRCHDDIGWTFSDDDAAQFGIHGFDHRRFLNEFYLGRFPGSFSRGLPFQEDPKTGDCRISGTCASLAGLEKAVSENDPAEIDLSIRRILMIHGIIMTAGGIPLIYLGDEIGMLNDYSYRENPAQSRDSRWVHRPKADWQRYERRKDPHSIEGRVFQGLKKLVELRKGNLEFSDGEIQVISSQNEHVLAYIRSNDEDQILILANFSEHPQEIPSSILVHSGFGKRMKQLHGTSKIKKGERITIAPFDFLAIK